MKLYELPRNSYFTVDSGKILETGDEPIYMLEHLDGMYSVCYDEQGKVIHWHVGTPVTKVEMH